MGWGWERESEGCSWGEAGVAMGAREDGGGWGGFRGSGAARLLGRGGCWGRALCMAEEEEQADVRSGRRRGNGAGTGHLPGEGRMGCWLRKG